MIYRNAEKAAKVVKDQPKMITIMQHLDDPIQKRQIELVKVFSIFTYSFLTQISASNGNVEEQIYKRTCPCWSWFTPTDWDFSVYYKIKSIWKEPSFMNTNFLIQVARLSAENQRLSAPNSEAWGPKW